MCRAAPRAAQHHRGSIWSWRGEGGPAAGAVCGREEAARACLCVRGCEGIQGGGTPNCCPPAQKAPALALVAAAAASQVALAVQRRGEGLVVEGAGEGVGALVGGHAGDAVLGLVRGQLSPQLLRRDVVLGGGDRGG